MSIEDEPRKRRSAANAGKAWATLIPTKKVLHDEDEVEEEGPGTKSQDALTASGSPRKARIQEDDEDYEEEQVVTKPPSPKKLIRIKKEIVNAAAPVTSPVKQVVVVKQKKIEPKPKSPIKFQPTSTSVVRVLPSTISYRPSTSRNSPRSSFVVNNIGNPAMPKERLADIEQEMRASYGDQDHIDDYEYERVSGKSFSFHGDEEDDFLDPPPIKTSKRSPSVNGSFDLSRKRGRPIGSKSSYTRKNERFGMHPGGSHSAYRSDYAHPSIREFPQIPRSINGTQNYLENRPVKVFMRPSADFSSPSQRPKLPTEVNNKFGNRLVAGDSVSKFNDLVDTLLNQIKTLSEDRTKLSNNYEELINQTNMAHATSIDLKESRIRQLEGLVGQLQQDNMKLISQLQSSHSQHESVPAPAKRLPGIEGRKRDYGDLQDSAQALAEREALEEFNQNDADLMEHE